MKYRFTFFLIILTNAIAFSQIATNSHNSFYAKEFSKDIALFNAKSYLFKTVLGTSTDIIQFEIIPLAAASSGELTTLLYKCEKKQKEGIVLGFYGTKWNDAGVIYTGYGFKNFEKDQAIEFLNKIQKAVNENTKFLDKDTDNNNIFFEFEDIDVLIWSSGSS